jgi:hypothetical protein
MACLAQRHEVWVIGVIVFHEDSFVLKAHYRDAVVVVFRERGNPQTKG